MGGMHGFGRVEEEPNEPVFHTNWESRVYAMNRAMGPLRLWTIDEGVRHRKHYTLRSMPVPAITNAGFWG